MKDVEDVLGQTVASPEGERVIDEARRNYQIRMAAFAFLERAVAQHGEVLPWSLLRPGFEFQGERIYLVQQQGIFKPKLLTDGPISIRTALDGPYDDRFSGSEEIEYAFRGTDPAHHDNRMLRMAMAAGVPLVYFIGVEEGRYFASWPAYVIGEDQGRLMFSVRVDERARIRHLTEEQYEHSISTSDEEISRRYATRQAIQRLHQHSFRERVLRAYKERCAICRLRHPELLDAAHIIGDTEPGGEPVVPNGLALCKLHHAAFDRQFIGVRPRDLRLIVRRDILEEEDGPMLQHGLKELHESKLTVPRRPDRTPDRERLTRRFDRFLAAQEAF